MSDRGNPIHGESITDGNASSGIAVTLYDGGSLTEHTVGDDEIVYITDIQIASEPGGDVSLCADGKVAGEYLWHGTLDAKDQISVHFNTPRACVRGSTLVFFGGASDLNTCIVEGFITK